MVLDTIYGTWSMYTYGNRQKSYIFPTPLELSGHIFWGICLVARALPPPPFLVAGPLK